ncbi:uncharacterized protein BKA78DRAFT_350949 [Phyllosticta capitalensis]|uniref:uncharacterized protein n=1 Tax=Phyllosticta capitalensis TaxID=121624 RepID=UPI003130B2F3
MKLFNVVLFAATAAAAAIPMPLNEADVEILRARGVSEADIAHALHPSPANPVASLLRRNIDADGEVQPSHYLSPHPHITRRWEGAGDMSAVEHDSSLTPAHKEHKIAIFHFMDNLMSGHLSGIAAGTGGTALRKRDAEVDEEKRSYVGGGSQANKFSSFGFMNGGMPRIMSWRGGRKGHGANSANVNSNANANNNNKALSTTTTSSSSANANANSAVKANSNAIKVTRAEEELTRPERWVYRW